MTRGVHGFHPHDMASPQRAVTPRAARARSGTDLGETQTPKVPAVRGPGLVSAAVDSLGAARAAKPHASRCRSGLHRTSVARPTSDIPRERRRESGPGKHGRKTPWRRCIVDSGPLVTPQDKSRHPGPRTDSLAAWRCLTLRTPVRDFGPDSSGSYVRSCGPLESGMLLLDPPLSWWGGPSSDDPLCGGGMEAQRPRPTSRATRRSSFRSGNSCVHLSRNRWVPGCWLHADLGPFSEVRMAVRISQRTTFACRTSPMRRHSTSSQKS